MKCIACTVLTFYNLYWKVDSPQQLRSSMLLCIVLYKVIPQNGISTKLLIIVSFPNSDSLVRNCDQSALLLFFRGVR